MTLHSNGLFRFWTASGCIDHQLMACFAFGAETKTLVFGATIHFVRHSKLLNHCAHFFDYLFILRSFGNINILNKVNGMVVEHSCVNFVFSVTPLRIAVAVGLY